MSMWTPCSQSLQSIPCPPQLTGWLYAQIIQPFFWLWAVPACLTYSLLGFMLMSSPILPWLRIGFMSLLALARCCHPAVSSSQLPVPMGHGKDWLPPCLQLQGKVQQLLKQSFPRWTKPNRLGLLSEKFQLKQLTDKGRRKCSFAWRILDILLLSLISLKIPALTCKNIKRTFFLPKIYLVTKVPTVK